MSLLDRVTDALNNARRSLEPLDPGRFNDPLACQTAWTPLVSGGTNICSHALYKANSVRLEFRPRPLALLFPAVFIVIGLIAGFWLLSQGLAGDSMLLLMGPLFGGAFVGIGVLILRSWARPRVFDKKLGYYWKGKGVSRLNQVRQQQEHCALNEIKALQIIREYCRSNSNNSRGRGYYSYELNLVLPDGKRLNVVDHGKLGQLRADARTLSHFLDRPLWDASDQ